MNYKLNKTEEEWKKELSPEEFRILRESGTERSGTGKYNMHEEVGLYTCAACDFSLFESEHKFHSGCEMLSKNHSNFNVFYLLGYCI